MVHLAAGIYPAKLLCGKMAEKILSVFIDESGDFGDFRPHSPYYLVAMVLHDQNADISDQIRTLDTRMQELGYPPHAIHVAPIIRRESRFYINDDIVHRKALFNAIYHFTRKLPVQYLCPYISKNECVDSVDMSLKLTRKIAASLESNLDFFLSYDRIIVYYDNGQIELARVLTSVFGMKFSHVDFRKIKPEDYKLVQVADFICTMELLSIKADRKEFSRSEKEFFDNERLFKKNRMKLIRAKQLHD